MFSEHIIHVLLIGSLTTFLFFQYFKISSPTKRQAISIIILFFFLFGQTLQLHHLTHHVSPAQSEEHICCIPQVATTHTPVLSLEELPLVITDYDRSINKLHSVKSSYLLRNKSPPEMRNS
jgi:hypothetical protein